MGRQMLSEREAVNDVRVAINEVLGGRWMIAVWKVDDSIKSNEPPKLSLVRRTCWKMPMDLFDVAVGQLARSIAEETLHNSQFDNPLPPAPLQIADFLKEDEDEASEKLRYETGPLRGGSADKQSMDSAFRERARLDEKL